MWMAAPCCSEMEAMRSPDEPFAKGFRPRCETPSETSASDSPGTTLGYAAPSPKVVAVISSTAELLVSMPVQEENLLSGMISLRK